MNPSLKALSNESYEEYLIRLGDNKDLFDPPLNWNQIAEIMNNFIDEEYSESKYRKEYKNISTGIEMGISKIDDNEYANEIRDASIELKKERIKLNSEKIEYNKMLREDARAELLEEKIIEAIHNRPTIEIPEIMIKKKENKKDLMIGIADAHVGASFKLRGINGEVMNEYNSNVFEKRMWKILEESIKYAENHKLNHAYVVDVGDSIDGILRMSQLMSLQMGVVDSAIYVGEFMSQWLNELSKYISIDYSTLEGNHNEIRHLTGKRGDFPNENSQRWITKLVESNLKNNKNVNIQNNKEFTYLDIVGHKILATHGTHEKNLENSIKDYMLVYGVKIDTFLCGHYHHSHEKTISIGDNGRGIDFIQLPAIIGADDYGLSLKKTSPAGAKLFVFEEGVGRTDTRHINLQNV